MRKRHNRHLASGTPRILCGKYQIKTTVIQQQALGMWTYISQGLQRINSNIWTSCVATQRRQCVSNASASDKESTQHLRSAWCKDLTASSASATLSCPHTKHISSLRCSSEKPLALSHMQVLLASTTKPATQPAARHPGTQGHAASMSGPFCLREGEMQGSGVVRAVAGGAAAGA